MPAEAEIGTSPEGAEDVENDAKRAKTDANDDVALQISLAPVVQLEKHLYQDNEGYELVDALPYIDTQLGQTEAAAQVKALIEEEMANFEPRDYLEALPPPELKLLNSGVIFKEMDRIEAGQPMTGIDTSRYSLQEPVGPQAQDLNMWKTVENRAQAQIEHSYLRIANLELLDKYGSRSWVAHMAHVKEVDAAISADVKKLQDEREEVNKKRKLDQISCGNELRRLAIEYEQYMNDNALVEEGLKDLDDKVQRLKETAAERDVMPPKLAEDSDEEKKD